MSISQMLLPEFDREMANTRKMLSNVPDDKLDYKPHPKSMTLGRLASHVAEMAGWLASVPGAESFEMPADWKPYVVTSRDELLKFFDENVARSRAALEKFSDNETDRDWTLIYGGKPVMKMKKLEVIRTMVMNHIIHHRAQLGVYYRLNDIPVPGMYGASADEKQPQ
jgi:uncharacterized damage-inducible protein DinB